MIKLNVEAQGHRKSTEIFGQDSTYVSRDLNSIPPGHEEILSITGRLSRYYYIIIIIIILLLLLLLLLLHQISFG